MRDQVKTGAPTGEGGRQGPARSRRRGGAQEEADRAIEEALYQTKNQSNQDPLNYPIRLNNKLAALGGL